MNYNAERELIRMAKELEDHAFVYLGNDEWIDAVTSLKHCTSVAFKILKQRMTPNPKPCDDDDLDPEYYCWHGDKPYGPGPYCTGCGGLIKPETV